MTLPALEQVRGKIIGADFTEDKHVVLHIAVPNDTRAWAAIVTVIFEGPDTQR